MDRMISTSLHEAISAICPIDGVSIGDPSNKATWRIDFAAAATAQQRAAATAIIASFNPNLGAIIDQIDAERDRRLGLGYPDAVTGKTFQTDAASIALLTAVGTVALALIAAGQPNKPLKLIPVDNSITFQLSATEMVDLLANRMMPWISGHRFNARDMKNRAIAGQNIDINAGWPQP